MVVEYLESFYRAEAEQRQTQPNNPFRASVSGHCIRQGGYDLAGLKGELLQPRRIAVFKHGDLIHEALTADLKAALGWRFLSGPETGDHFVEIDGEKISFHPDGFFQWDEGIGILEVKSMNEFSFNRALKGEIDKEYLAQAYVYWKGTDFNPVVFICYRKNTSHMVEIVFDRTATEKIVTQRLTGDPIELAKQDPLLLTEIKTPFDPSVEEYVRERIKWLKRVGRAYYCELVDWQWIRAEVPGVEAVEDEIENVQGKDKARARAEALDIAPEKIKQSGSWYSFPTGRKVLGFPCGGYCQHMARCYPQANMEMKGDKPVWVISEVPK